MELRDFVKQTQVDIRALMQEGSVFAELAFSEIVMDHMAQIGMTFEPVVCHYKGRFGSAHLRLSGYAISEDDDELSLFVTLYDGADEPSAIPDSETTAAAQQCLKFLAHAADGTLVERLDPSTDVHALALTIREMYNRLEDVRIFVLTDRVAKSKSFKPRKIGGKDVRLEVMDIERLYRHWSEGKPRDELVVDFEQAAGAPLPCVYVPGGDSGYDLALTAVPGEALRQMYERYGQRLLEANVRSFLSAKGKGVNANIQATLRTTPERFMAFNNGIVLVADEIGITRSADGGSAIAWIKGMQIVNGGQTTASLYFSKRKFPDLDLAKVRVPAKVVVLRDLGASDGAADEESLISDISRYANSQNAVKQSDLSANKPFHVALEQLSISVYCPSGTGRWFYERAAGSYSTMLARLGTTAARLRSLREEVPTTRRITKTELAKFETCWAGRPDVVSLGSQKCFDRFMAAIAARPVDALPNVAEYKEMIARAIVFRSAQKIVRPMFQAFQANVVAYTVAMLARHTEGRFRLGTVWDNQSLSAAAGAQIAVWAREVNDRLHATAAGRMVSEWAKKPECLAEFEAFRLSAEATAVPEWT